MTMVLIVSITTIIILDNCPIKIHDTIVERLSNLQSLDDGDEGSNNRIAHAWLLR